VPVKRPVSAAPADEAVAPAAAAEDSGADA
jgi:hypothetical protein